MSAEITSDQSRSEQTRADRADQKTIADQSIGKKQNKKEQLGSGIVRVASTVVAPEAH